MANLDMKKLIHLQNSMTDKEQLHEKNNMRTGAKKKGTNKEEAISFETNWRCQTFHLPL